jgi:pimeloyl-ACP methyl ester carboxylesterase
LTSLADADTRRAFLATSRSVIDAGGQTVSARSRLSGLTAREVLLIWGAGDRMIPSAHIEAARAELPHSQAVILPRSGHFPHLDEPDAFAAVLARFVRTAGRAAGDLEAPAARPAAG